MIRDRRGQFFVFVEVTLNSDKGFVISPIILKNVTALKNLSVSIYRTEKKYFLNEAQFKWKLACFD